MAWFTLARVLFVASVAYAAAILEPFPVGFAANVAFALALAALVVLFESRLRDLPITRVLGALIGCAIGLAIAHTIVTGLFWADNGDRRGGFLPLLALILLSSPGLGVGGKHPGMAETAPAGRPFSAPGAGGAGEDHS